MKDFGIYYLIVIISLVVIILAYVCFRSKTLLPIGKIAERAFAGSDFQQTEYWIYDKTVDNRCDRLIVVKPFDWYLLNVNRQLFVLDPERPIACNPSQLAALRVLRATFIETCKNINLETLLAAYDDKRGRAKLYKIPYTFKSNRFTVLTAINELAENYLDFQPDVKSLRSKAKLHNVYNLFGRGTNITNLKYARRYNRSAAETSTMATTARPSYSFTSTKSMILNERPLSSLSSSSTKIGKEQRANIVTSNSLTTYNKYDIFKRLHVNARADDGDEYIRELNEKYPKNYIFKNRPKNINEKDNDDDEYSA